MSEERTAAVMEARPGPEDERGLLSGDELKSAAAEYETSLRARVLGPQRGVATFFDAAIHDLLKVLEKLPAGVPWEVAIHEAPLREAQHGFLNEAFETFRIFLTRRGRGRFREHGERRRSYGSDLPPLVQKMSQGVGTCLSWHGMPLFKSVFDFAVYTMMLADVRPRTLFEIGAGTGASASWLSDVVRSQELDARIYSFDLVRPAVVADGVVFIEGDCNEIASALSTEVLDSAPHPWVVIEDAHVNVLGVLEHFDLALREGDYLVVEDSKDKRPELTAFCERHPDRYRVDTHYTDFFGKNCTTAHDSILRCMTDRDGAPSPSRR